MKRKSYFYYKKKPESPQHYKESDLIARGWSKKMIRTLLPGSLPENAPSRKKSSGKWRRDLVCRLEQTEGFRRMAKKESEYRSRRAAREEALRLAITQATISVHPKDEYPAARRLHRRFVLHIGPTNSGKTHDALERLGGCVCGVYLGPLRLLALEVYDRFHAQGIPCVMLTGEEMIADEEAAVTACTIEMMDPYTHYDVAVIDEAQMIADPMRGHNWTRALLGLCADEIHVCMAPEAEEIVRSIIIECGDEIEIHRTERLTPLRMDKTPFHLRNIEKGDALIVFSRRSVLELSAAIENAGHKASVIYGDLPPAARREQVAKFMSGENDVVVSTDAIGMGLNLAIRRVIFAETKKFDGTAFRSLYPGEIRQIAGRAGRYGLYPEGIVASVEDPDFIADGLSAPVPAIVCAHLGFPETLVNLEGSLISIMQAWASTATDGFYKKMDLSELLFLYSALFDRAHDTAVALGKQEIYRLITCSVNIKNEDMVAQWLSNCRAYAEGAETLPLPKVAPSHDLRACETEYHCLDLYFQCSRKTGKSMQEEYLAMRKEELVSDIDRLLSKQKSRFSRRCVACGRSLPYRYPFSQCEHCFQENWKTDAGYDGKKGKRAEREEK